MFKLNVIIPFDANECEKFASEELAFFLGKVSNVELNILSEPIAKTDLPFISLGNTTLYQKQAGDFNLKQKVGLDGYRILVKENCAFICGGAGQGTIYGVYGYLKEFFNLVIFTENVYTYDKKDFYFSPLDKVVKPDFPMRALGIYPVHLEKREPDMGNLRYCYRMRLRQMDEGWGINNHCFFSVVPPSIYKNDHPEWYSQGGKQLCLTNKGVIAEYVKNMKKIIEDTPDDVYYMLGMQDTLEQCHCPECKKFIDEYGFAALLITFCNTIVKELNVWLKEKHPEREVYFFSFAYVWAIKPPVEKDALGNYHCILKDFKAEDNFGVRIAPLYTSTYYAWNDPRAQEALCTCYYGDRMPLVDIFEGWRAIVNNIAIWAYNHNFSDYMAPNAMWAHADTNFRYFKSLDTKHFFVEAGTGEKSNFAEMKIFVFSNLMWDTSLSIDDLIHQFMSVCFKGAEKELYEYFVDIHKHAEWLKQTYNRETIFVIFDDDPNLRLLDKRFWPLDWLMKWYNIFDSVLSHDLDADVRARVELEFLPVLFTLLYTNLSNLDKGFAFELVNKMLRIAKESDTDWAINEEEQTFTAFAEKWLNELNK